MVWSVLYSHKGEQHYIEMNCMGAPSLKAVVMLVHAVEFPNSKPPVVEAEKVATWLEDLDIEINDIRQRA